MNQFPYYPMPQYQPQQMPQQKPQTAFVVLPTEDEALRYPMAPGSSIMFKIESQPIVIEKTMGFSQLDSPVIAKYRLVKEDAPEPTEAPEYALKEDIDSIREEIDKIHAMISRRRKKEETDE